MSTGINSYRRFENSTVLQLCEISGFIRSVRPLLGCHTVVAGQQIGPIIKGKLVEEEPFLSEQLDTLRSFRQNHEVDSASENEYQGFLLR